MIFNACLISHPCTYTVSWCQLYVILLNYIGCGWFDSVTSCISLSTPSELFKGYRNQLDCKGIWIDKGIDDSGASNATTEDTSLTTGSDVESTACRALIWPRRPHLESSLLGLQQVWRRMTAKPCFHCMILGRVYAPARQQFHDILIYYIYNIHISYGIYIMIYT